MRTTRTIAMLFIVVLLSVSACANPVTTSPPASPTPPAPTPTPIPQVPAPAPAPTPVPATPVQGPYDVWIPGNQYMPSTLTVPVGTKVTWTNKEGNIHTVTSNDGLFDSGILGFGQTFSYTFTARGTFNYYCIPHEGMTGQIIVQ
jgi:plastocyanin